MIRGINSMVYGSCFDISTTQSACASKGNWQTGEGLQGRVLLTSGRATCYLRQM